MSYWHIVLWLFAIAGIAGSLYGLHRLCLWLEERGLLYYKHKRAGSTAAGCFVALQQALEPQSQHVLYVGEEKRHHSDEEAPGDVMCQRSRVFHPVDPVNPV